MDGRQKKLSGVNWHRKQQPVISGGSNGAPLFVFLIVSYRPQYGNLTGPQLLLS